MSALEKRFGISVSIVCIVQTFDIYCKSIWYYCPFRNKRSGRWYWITCLGLPVARYTILLPWPKMLRQPRMPNCRHVHARQSTRLYLCGCTCLNNIFLARVVVTLVLLYVSVIPLSKLNVTLVEEHQSVKESYTSQIGETVLLIMHLPRNRCPHKQAKTTSVLCSTYSTFYNYRVKAGLLVEWLNLGMVVLEETWERESQTMATCFAAERIEQNKRNQLASDKDWKCSIWSGPLRYTGVFLAGVR